jgi:hypothetical protein
MPLIRHKIRFDLPAEVGKHGGVDCEIPPVELRTTLIARQIQIELFLTQAVQCASI